MLAGKGLEVVQNGDAVVIRRSGNSGSAAAASETVDEEIVVTGSRIAKSEFTSADPIQIVDPEAAKLQGQLELAAMLRSAPAAQGSIQITSTISNRFIANGGNDVQSLSLRGLGPERTLVLINGRRAGPAGIRGSVAPFDLNVLPLSVVREAQVKKSRGAPIPTRSRRCRTRRALPLRRTARSARRRAI